MRQSFTKGFSLIELLVSLSIFTIVITMAVGTLLVLIDANAKAQNLQTAMTNLNFALDSMTREIRTGSIYYCDTSAPSGFIGSDDDDVNDCSDGGSFLSIVEGGNSLTGPVPGNDRIEYRFVETGDLGRIERRIEGAGGWLPLTSDDIDINEFRFHVIGSVRGDGEQPRVTIYVSGTAGDLVAVETTFDLQTTVTQRLLDI